MPLILDVLCGEHRDAVENAKATRALKATIPALHQVARPSDLTLPALRDWAPTNGSGLYLYGPVGSGKSFAAAALMKRAYIHSLRAGIEAHPIWMNVPIEQLQTNADISAKRWARPAERWLNAQAASVLVLDDIGMEQPKENIRTRMYGLIEHRVQHRLPTIITSNLDLDKLATRLESPQIASRISQMCSQVSFEGSEDRRPALAPQLDAGGDR
jgi:DNA replication protein DnaC